MKTSAELLSKQKEKILSSRPKKSDLHFVPNRPLMPKTTEGDIGIEVEAESGVPDGLPTRLGRSIWVAKADGSLRNGMEYVLREPVAVDTVEQHVQSLRDLLAREQHAFQNSNRTSTHIHINIQGLKVNEITSFILLWCLFEPLFINWCGEGRKRNHFCLSNEDTQNYIGRNWLNALRDGSFVWDRASKYSAINLATIHTFGSLEFRCMRGLELDNPEIIVNWAKMLHALREEARTEYFDPSIISEHLSEMGGYALLRHICEKYEVPIFDQLVEPYGNHEEFVNPVLLDAFRYMQDICYAINWRENIDNFRKEYVTNPFSPDAVNGGVRRRGARFFEPADLPEPDEIDDFADDEEEEF